MYNHHMLCKNATDKAIYNWKHREWDNKIISSDVFRSNASQSFPSPDSMLYDPEHKRKVAFEFKPPTETKRGILTGLGQTIVYLENASMSYLVSPAHVEGYAIGEFMENVFQNNIYGNIPVGLILYNDDEAKNINIVVDIAPELQLNEKKANLSEGRFWAKHSDLPLHGIWLLLDVAYEIENCVNKRDLVKEVFTDKHLFPEEHRGTLEVFPTKILKDDGTPMFHMNKVKNKLKKAVDNGSKTEEDALHELYINGTATKNKTTDKKLRAWFPFLVQMNLWDDHCNLLDDGYDLHKYGKMHGPTSETFKYYFSKLLLTNGKHLELIIEVERHTRNKQFENVNEALANMRKAMIEKGQFRENPNRSSVEDIADYSTEFFKYERLIWSWLGFIPKGRDEEQYIPNKGFKFNWEHITNILLYK